MLLKFKVSNFGSIGGLQEFNMLCGNTRAKQDHISEIGNVRVLKNAVMYGANAAGKSKFISSIEVSQSIILSSLTSRPDIRKMYCRVDQDNKKKTSYFEYIFSVGNRFFSYGFEAVLNELRIDSEWLIELDSQLGEDRLIFQRESGNVFSFGNVFDKEAGTRLGFYASDMKNMQANTFLSEMNQKNLDENESLKIFRTIYSWFKTKLFVNHVKMPDKKSISAAGRILKGMDTDISGLSSNLISQKELENYPQNSLAYIENYLRGSASTPSQSVYITPDWVLFELGNNGLKASKLLTIHGSNNLFDIAEESSGTVNVLYLISLLTDEEDDVTYIWDGFGNSLHPKLSYRFMELLQKHNENSSRQFIVSTHEVALMTLDLYRRDEIWFIEKNDGVSSLYSLEEFKERFDKILSKAYIEGRYGALPSIKSVEGE